MRRSQAQAPPHHPVVLIVEDSQTRLDAIQDVLESAEFLVLPAANATEALELAELCAGPIHLLITKLHPAEMAAPDLVGRLRQRSPTMGVLYSAANPLATLEIPDPEEVVSCMLPSPFSKEILLQRVQKVLTPQG
jgi:two-component system, cell cycle sensor histidine kinase and response regulator CckA